MKGKIIALSFLMLLITIGFGSALVLNVNEFENISSSTKITLNLSTDKTANFYYLNNLGLRSRWRILCRDAMRCENTIRLREGENEILIKAVDKNGVADIKNKTVFIDSKKPRIRKISPRKGFVNDSTLFEIKFTEKNPESLVLHYGNAENPKNKSIDLSSCMVKRTTYSCNVSSITLELSEFDGEETEYWFNITDDAGNSDNSKKEVYLNVDLTAPKIVDFKKNVLGRRVEFLFEVNEDNFDKIMYKDLADRNPKFKKLCRNLKFGRCFVKKSFKAGDHKLEMVVFDKAGNQEKEFCNFTVY